MCCVAALFMQARRQAPRARREARRSKRGKGADITEANEAARMSENGSSAALETHTPSSPHDRALSRAYVYEEAVTPEMRGLSVSPAAPNAYPTPPSSTLSDQCMSTVATHKTPSPTMGPAGWPEAGRVDLFPMIYGGSARATGRVVSSPSMPGESPRAWMEFEVDQTVSTPSAYDQQVGRVERALRRMVGSDVDSLPSLPIDRPLPPSSGALSIPPRWPEQPSQWPDASPRRYSVHNFTPAAGAEILRSPGPIGLPWEHTSSQHGAAAFGQTCSQASPLRASRLQAQPSLESPPQASPAHSPRNLQRARSVPSSPRPSPRPQVPTCVGAQSEEDVETTTVVTTFYV